MVLTVVTVVTYFPSSFECSENSGWHLWRLHLRGRLQCAAQCGSLRAKHHMECIFQTELMKNEEQSHPIMKLNAFLNCEIHKVKNRRFSELMALWAFWAKRWPHWMECPQVAV